MRITPINALDVLTCCRGMGITLALDGEHLTATPSKAVSMADGEALGDLIREHRHDLARLLTGHRVEPWIACSTCCRQWRRNRPECACRCAP
jgi:hypothetical protein